MIYKYLGGISFFRGVTVTNGTLYHIALSGQSLAQGGTSIALSDSQPYDNLMMSPRYDAAWLLPLIEAGNEFGGTETPASGLANTLTHLAGWRCLITNNAGGGKLYTEIKKGTAYHQLLLDQITNAIANVDGGTYEFYGASIIHGEADRTAGTPQATYEGYLSEWQSDIDADARAITGQARDVIFVLDQMGTGTGAERIHIAQYKASRGNANIYLACPKYWATYNDASHLDEYSYRRLGEYHAKAWRSIINGNGWTPLQPASVSRSGAIITVQFDVPTAPLVLDTTTIAEQANYGFSYADNGDGNSVAIVGVEIADANAGTMTITLDGAPTGTGQLLRYAYGGGARGNLRDSDATASLYDNDLWNWCVHFEEAIA